MSDIQNLLLQIIGASLFNKDVPRIKQNQISELIKEANSHSVFPLMFSVIKKQVEQTGDKKTIDSCMQLLFACIAAQTSNFVEHGELHRLMADNGIGYVAMKGISSAMYYPNPNLRCSGDVDVFVCDKDFDSAQKLIESAGFEKEKESNDEIHIAYKRPPFSIWELHKSVNGIPKNEVGENIAEEIRGIVETAVETTIEGTVCMVPDQFHHGLILLLHTASHLTSEGVGLRHLCDWVVFVSSINDDDFVKLFKEKLQSFGLWRFAQVLTLLGVNYFSAPKRKWAMMNENITDDQLEALMTDILNGGNFGKKDMNRYREIKYISNRADSTIDNGSVFVQVIKTLNYKVYSDFSFIDKHRYLLPIGWCVEGFKYIALLLQGKRKSTGTKKMLKEAIKRKSLYLSLKLFER